MTMLEIFKSKLPEGVEVVKAKEKPSKWDVVIGDGQSTTATSILKAYAPNAYNHAAESIMMTVMASLALNRGDITEAKRWLDMSHEHAKKEI